MRKMMMMPSAAEVTRAEGEYVQAMSKFGADSAEAYAANQHWRHLRQRFYQRRQPAHAGYLH